MAQILLPYAFPIQLWRGKAALDVGEVDNVKVNLTTLFSGRWWREGRAGIWAISRALWLELDLWSFNSFLGLTPPVP